MTEGKVALSRKRAELVEILAASLSNEDRFCIQAELSVINAKIKALNTTEAAQLKAAADRRRAAGMARAWAKITGTASPVNAVDDDPGQTEVIDGWIDAVLLRHDVEFTRQIDGAIKLEGPPEWRGVVAALIDGVYAAARGQELPDLPSASPVAERHVPKTVKLSNAPTLPKAKKR